RAGVRQARPRARRRPHADRRTPCPAAGRAAADRQYRPDDRGRDLRRDGAVVPRSRRPRADLARQGDRERVRAGGDLDRRLVGDSAAGRARRDHHPQLLADRRRARGRAEPAAAGRAPVRAHVPAAAAGRAWDRRGMSLLALEDLHVWFELEGGGELHAVRGVDLAIDAGERLGLVGESGCGKTTTALAVLGLLPPTASVSGRVLLDGEDVLAGGEATIRPHRWTDVAIVFQGAMNALNPVKTVGAQIVEALELHGVAHGA